MDTNLKAGAGEMTNSEWIIDGNTLVKRTRQRNWLLMRLHGARRFADYLGLDRAATDFEVLIKITKQRQKLDTIRTRKKRKKAND